MTMSTMSKTIETPLNPNQQINNVPSQTTGTQKISLYEQSREQRIKENMERMQKLGIVDLSHQLRSTIPRKRAPRYSSDQKTPQRPSLMPPSGPTRRSSRLQNATPVSYTEVDVSKKKVSSEDKELLLERGSRPEVYTEEHEKLLGSTERSWTLFVDGCGSDGKRIYDSFKGKTCHQCRQKTLGHRTRCSKCDMVQGQFCGDCLYMRYGEHVLEANENPNWVCPVCRGICNCSLCRQAKGWPPTGALYRKISSLGFKSVAHYLVQTRRGETNPEGTEDTINQVSAKRSLPFSGLEAESTESPDINNNLPESLKPQSEDKKEGERENEMYNSLDPSSNNQPSVKRSLPFSCMEAVHQNLNVADAGVEHADLVDLQSENSRDDQFKVERENKTQSYQGPSTNQPSARSPLALSDVDEQQVDNNHPGQLELTSDDKRDEQDQGKEEKGLHVTDKEHADDLIELQSESISNGQVKVEKEDKTQSYQDPSTNQPSVKSPLLLSDMEGEYKKVDDNHHPGQLELPSDDKRDEREQGKEEKVLHFTGKEQADDNTALKSSAKPRKKRALVIEPTQDSIAKRLKLRRGRG